MKKNIVLPLLAFVILCASVALLGLAYVIVLRESDDWDLPSPRSLPMSNELRVKSVLWKEIHTMPSDVVAISPVAAVCGDGANAGRYEARNDALRSIMRSRSLTKEDAAALLDYLASTNDAMRVERVAALKNDVMNLLRRQETPVEGLGETAMRRIKGRSIAK